jgi:RecB family exonuclease
MAARPLDGVQIGLGPARRGSLLHKALELFWTEVGSHQDLLALDAEQLRRLVGEMVERAIEEMPVSSRQTMTPRFSQIEAERLGNQIVEWLEVEKMRSPFTVVGNPEQRYRFDIEGVEGAISIDRIDQLDNGRFAVTDYKTGKVSAADWFGDRPDEPQLPLYCEVLGDRPIDAVAFAEINTSNVRFVGAVKERGLLPGLPNSRGSKQLKEATETWPRILDDWSLVIRRLASEFSRGEVAIDPAKGLKTCESAHCSLAPLCRIHEAVILADDNDDDAGVSDD